MPINIYSDGGSRGNPGPAAIGFVIYKDSEKIHSYNEYVGNTTNNVAEYKAILEALRQLLIKEICENTLNLYLDSELVVKQLTGEYKVKKNHLRDLVIKINLIITKLKKLGYKKINIKHIRREKNKEADKQVNIALDLYNNY